MVSVGGVLLGGVEDFDVSVGALEVLLLLELGALLGGVVLAEPDGAVEVDDDEALPLAGGAVGASAGFTSTLELEDDAGGVELEVSVLEQPTTPTPTARRAARRYDGFIVRFPSSVVGKKPLARGRLLHCKVVRSASPRLY